MGSRQRLSFVMEWDAAMAGDFSDRVLAVVRRVPVGRIVTYGDVALAAGRPRAWRAVGNIMRECRDPGVPCHRVVAAAGRLGGYGGNTALTRALLIAEGVSVVGSRVRDFSRRRWRVASRSVVRRPKL